jgi:serine/threonine-protein kinase
VLDLLASVADGQSPDWDGLETGSAAADPRALRILRTIAGVADVHRTLDSLDASSGVSGSGETPVARPWPAAVRTWGPLSLKEKLGSGASSDVYRAYDRRLDCDVALKLFKTQTGGQRERVERRLREARMLARVRHDNIVQVFGADEHDGFLGIWMELVDGRTLEQELQGRGRWSGREAAAAGQDLCRALAAVHSAGFTHGDIKAHNVVREDGGRLVLMDFGAGRPRISEARPESGTPLYLAPEVLAGSSPGVESDLYSLGVLLYHLVTKTYPITAATVDELRAKHARHEAVPLANVRPDLDLPFVRVVERALAPKPEDRFRSAGEMEAALAQALGTVRPDPVRATRTWWPLAFAALAIVTVVLAWMALRPPVAPASPQRIAVIPFRAVGDGEHAKQISEGVSADLTSLLFGVSGIHVVSGVSVERFRNSTQSATEIGRALGVDVLVAGVVQVADGRVSVHVELVDTENSQQLWSKRYDRLAGELFRTQSEIALAIVTEVKGSLSDDDEKALERPQMDFQAFEYYSIGRYHWNKRTPEGFKLAIHYFEQAIAADPTAALPHVGLSDAYTLAAVYGVLPTTDAHPRAEAAAIKGVELDPHLAEAQAALGSIRQEQLRWPEAEAAFSRAIELKPGYQLARHWYALYLTSHRRFDEAIEQMRVGLTQDPLSVAARGALAFIYYMKQDYTSALEHYHAARELEPRSWLFRNLAIISMVQGSYDDALTWLERIEPGDEPEADLKAIRANVYALAGRWEEARRLLLDDPAAVADGSSGIEQAAARFALGDDSDAYAWLNAALEYRQHDIQYLAVEPRFESKRADPRFRALLDRAGLPRGP